MLHLRAIIFEHLFHVLNDVLIEYCDPFCFIFQSNNSAASVLDKSFTILHGLLSLEFYLLDRELRSLFTDYLVVTANHLVVAAELFPYEAERTLKLLNLV